MTARHDAADCDARLDACVASLDDIHRRLDRLAVRHDFDPKDITATKRFFTETLAHIEKLRAQGNHEGAERSISGLKNLVRTIKREGATHGYVPELAFGPELEATAKLDAFDPDAEMGYKVTEYFSSKPPKVDSYHKTQEAALARKRELLAARAFGVEVSRNPVRIR